MKKTVQSSTKSNVQMRSCCGCRQSYPKKELVRIVRTPEREVKVDFTGRMNGRGAYLCKNIQCLNRAHKTGSIARSLDIQITDEIYAELEKELMNNEA